MRSIGSDAFSASEEIRLPSAVLRVGIPVSSVCFDLMNLYKDRGSSLRFPMTEFTRDLRIGNFHSSRNSNRQIVVYSFNVKFLLIAIWDKSQMYRFVENIARLLLGY